MKTMRALAPIAQDLFDAMSSRMEEPLKKVIVEFLECGEEGCAADFTVDWAIKNDFAIPEKSWRELNEFYSTSATAWSVESRTQLMKATHAA
jgi:hypothetical protein